MAEGRFVSPGLPETLYHYTSPSGLRGIVQDKALWCSSAHFLSDAEEISHAVNETRPLLQELGEEFREGEHVFAGEIALVERMVQALEEIETEPVFVGSFSVEGNLLSQWRAYCPDRGGYSIGFDGEKLAALATAQGFNLVRCVYSRDDYWPELEDLVMYTLEHYRTGRREDHIPEKDLATNLVESFHAGLAELAARVKHPAFREEKEWRLVSSPISASLLPTQFREGASSLVPFIEFALEIANEEQLEDSEFSPRDVQLPIREIVVGPTPHPELARQSAQMLCEGESAYPTMKPSGIPYRTW